MRPAIRRLQPFRYLHDCSGCFRLERVGRVGFSPTGKDAAFARRTPVADLPAVGGTASYGGLPAIASWLFMSPQWRACAPVCAALRHDHSFKQLRRHPAAEFWDAAAFCGWPQDCAEPARTQPEHEGFPQPIGYQRHDCATKLRHGGAVRFTQASHEQYRNADKRASEWNVAPSFLLMWKQVRNVKFSYACTVRNKPRSERPARARRRRLLGASELGLGTVTPLCGLSRQFGLPPGPASSPTGATGRLRTERVLKSAKAAMLAFGSQSGRSPSEHGSGRRLVALHYSNGSTRNDFTYI